MRPLPIESVSGGREFVCGVAVIRGAPVPVVDLEVVLGSTERDARPTRFVTVQADGQSVALAVGAVVGVREIEASEFQELPPLLRDTRSDLIEAVATADARLLLVLRAARLIPDEMPTSISGASALAVAR
jgi:purine-binding chemotaxis protein CheW